ncbi:uncharacterized protein BCR38DRAFT_411654 [Pseudomassariella vexata]|uniref:Hypersensitive response-inducing protein n=1 Tax=Pseudomassariella vexata TaxID=1141098 RepID=A0A1Y2DMK0_9PEZI|nr:uncharacterized protein BCR38DRAFT_411654 [Pseudomassariella vexata]ORY60502.1 hypothetical protein BCR38DRAFT_411654 [Pseudomassariella vexata]
MKSSSIIATLFATASLGAVLRNREGCGFDVVQFYASCVPHSLYCSYSFNVTSESITAPVECSSFVQGPDYLPTIPLTGCSDPTVSYSFDVGEDAFTLAVTTASSKGQNLTGTHTITADEVVVDDNGSVRDQRYIGPQNFTISAALVEI